MGAGKELANDHIFHWTPHIEIRLPKDPKKLEELANMIKSILEDNKQE